MFDQFHDFAEFAADIVIALAFVRKKTFTAVFNSSCYILVIPTAVFAKSIEWAIAEQTVEILRVVGGVTGEELAFRVLHEGVVALAGLLVKYVIAHVMIDLPLS